MITLRKMDEEEFCAFRETSISDYAEDLLSGQDMDREQALSAAENEFDGTLPDGLGTEHSFIMNVEDARGNRVGWIFFKYYVGEDDEFFVFLEDLLIFEGERRKGYASEAIREMNEQARRDGCSSSLLFVWDHNPAGMRLYEKCGYTPDDHETGGTYMIRKL